VSNAWRADHAERKALLATRAELDRTRVMIAVHEIKAIVSPASDADRVGRARPLAAMLVGLLGPLAGAPRLARWLRVASLALVALRIARDWRGSAR
jgi:hypothetical protein